MGVPYNYAFDHPAFRNHSKLVQFRTFGDFHRRPQYLQYQILKLFAGIAAIGQHLAHLGQTIVVQQEHQ